VIVLNNEYVSTTLEPNRHMHHNHNMNHQRKRACTTASLEAWRAICVSQPTKGEKQASSLRTTDTGSSLVPVLARTESSRLKAAAACSWWASQLLSSSPAMTAPH